jgi:hypothetical protein
MHERSWSFPKNKSSPLLSTFKLAKRKSSGKRIPSRFGVPDAVVLIEFVEVALHVLHRQPVVTTIRLVFPSASSALPQPLLSPPVTTIHTRTLPARQSIHAGFHFNNTANLPTLPSLAEKLFNAKSFLKANEIFRGRRIVDALGCIIPMYSSELQRYQSSH